jgi:hypothetical protein
VSAAAAANATPSTALVASASVTLIIAAPFRRD